MSLSLRPSWWRRLAPVAVIVVPLVGGCALTGSDDAGVAESPDSTDAGRETDADAAAGNESAPNDGEPAAYEDGSGAARPGPVELGDAVAGGDFVDPHGAPFRFDVLGIGPSSGATTRMEFAVTNRSTGEWDPASTLFGLSNFSYLALIDLENDLLYGTMSANGGFDCVCSPFGDRAFAPGETRIYEARFDALEPGVSAVDVKVAEVGIIPDVPVGS